MNDDNTNTGLTDAALRLIAERAAGDPFYFAYSLDAYQRAHRLADAALASELGCSEHILFMVFACRQPEIADAARFASDVQAIASRFDIPAGRLASLARKAASVAAPRPAAANRFVTRPTAYGMAAQDREPEIDPEVGEPESGQP